MMWRWLINKLRMKRGLAPYDPFKTIWENVYMGNNMMVVEIYKLDNPYIRIRGGLKKVSRPYEAEKAVLLDYVEEWAEDAKVHRYKVLHSYVDFKNGIVMDTLDWENPEDLEEDDE